MAKVQLRGITKSYANLEVIHGIDIDITDGEFIVIVGPSGCGKSTLLRMRGRERRDHRLATAHVALHEAMHR